jgi:hypothetical protein
MRALVRGLGLMGAMLGGTCAASVAFAQAAACSKTDFEGVVDEAAGSLRELTRKHTPHFQAKLRQLKDKRGWSHEVFLKEAAPFVRDEQIAALDQRSEEFLARITSGGQLQSTAAAPDCALLRELRNAMQALVEVQKAKWTYMFDKIDKELGK